MEANHNFKSWRDLLGQAIKNSQEKHRLAHEMGVKPVTLKRWASGESRPREENIRRLARALPTDLSGPFFSLIEAEFPSLSQEEVVQHPIVPEIPAELYAQAMQIYTQMPLSLAYNALYELIFSRALEHFDPEKRGMSLVLVACVPPVGGQKVRCLRQLRGMGTPPWERDLSRRTIFLGSESAAGSAVMNYRGVSVSSRDADTFTPANWTDYEQSAIASPILRQARIAGALLASSARPHYFDEAHQTLLDHYAHLTALLFRPEEFYDSADIMLGVMPPLAQQLPYFENFDQRVALKFEEARLRRTTITIQQASLRAWQDIAEELLQISPH
jgi:transcriptional regulator with XRE-family HTH domain